MIEFYEAEPFSTKSDYDQITRTYIPVYLRRGTQTFFVTNRLVKETGYAVSPLNIDVSTHETEDFKTRLIASGCRYFKRYGRFDSPLDLMDFVEKENHTFSAQSVDKMLEQSRRNDGTVPFTEFHGNLTRLSAAFSYYLYDEKLVESLKTRAVGHLSPPQPPVREM